MGEARCLMATVEDCSEGQLDNAQQSQQPEVQGCGGEQHPKNDGGGAHIAARAVLRTTATLLHLLILEGENGFFIPGEFLVHSLRVQHSTKVRFWQYLSPGSSPYSRSEKNAADGAKVANSCCKSWHNMVFCRHHDYRYNSQEGC